MNTNLLRSWLNLAPGPWPPDDRTLLGFSAGPVSPQDAERQAMLLIGKLRPHQLIHPELVTEGMNRLAQAMLSITTATVAPPTLPKSPPPNPVPPQASQSQVPVDFNPGPTPVVLSPLPVDLKPAPVILDAEAINDDLPALPTFRFQQEDVATTASPTLDVELPAIPIPQVVPPNVPVGMSTESRRLAYRELVALRGLMQAWDQLRPFFANPSEKAETPGRVFALLEAITAFRAASNHPGLNWGEVQDVAPRVVAVSKQPLILPVFRMLLPTQRQLLARDWAIGKAHFEALRIGLRKSLRQSRPGVTISRSVEIVASKIGQNPEWVLGLSTAFVLCMAGVRILIR